MGKVKIGISIGVAVALTALVFALILSAGTIDVLPVSAQEATSARKILQNSLENGKYSYVDFLEDNGVIKADASECNIIESFEIFEGNNAVYTVNAQKAGLYSLSVEYEILGQSFSSVPLAVLVNGESQYYEAQTVTLPVFWQDESKNFPVDKYGDETVPAQTRITEKRKIDLFDSTYASDKPLLFLLKEGENIVEIFNESSQVVRLSSLTATGAKNIAQNTTNGADYLGIVNINSVNYDYKNTPYIQLSSVFNAALSPYDALNKKINVLQMGAVGGEVFFDINAPEDGFYSVSLHVLTGKEDFSSFLSVKIDGEFPFEAAASYALAPFADSKWHNQTLMDENGTPYKFYLSKGAHVLSLKLETAPTAKQTRDLNLLIEHINKFALDVKKVTGKDIDKNRTWRLTRYIPETAEFLDAYDTVLREIIYELAEFSPKGINCSVITGLVEALTFLDKLREKPDELPLYADNLSGDTSVLQLCGAALDSLLSTGIQVDAVYLGAVNQLPRENANAMDSFGGSAQRLWQSYTSSKYTVKNDGNAINVWVNQTALHADAMQKLADTRFTPATGIKVNISVMPDANKLILSRAAGTNPDIAAGLLAHMPFDLASRGALYDMSRFDDFWEYMGNFVPGSITSYIFNEGVYAAPETIDFAALVYRKDILDNLSIPVPDTWTDVTEMMSELQRFDMSFYMPIASGDGYKWFYQTSPLIYQNNGTLYRSDGLGTTINEPNSVKGLTFLGNLFTTYALAEQVPSFFNSFRYGKTPVGIMDSAAYLLLKYGAPELSGQWSVAPYPGTAQEDGSVSRWFIANGRGSVIFENTKRPDDCWQFVKWWLSDEIQSEYAFTMAANFNVLWISANLQALPEAPVEDKDLRVIVDSVKWLRDVPRSPGQYMLERSLSDVWNTMVFDGTPAQVAIDMASIDIQREFQRKMTEFGYIDAQGNVLKKYSVRELDWVLEKIDNAKKKAGEQW